MELLVEDTGEETEDPLHLLSYYSRMFVTNLKKTRAICLNVAANLPEEDLNLQPAHNYSTFLDGAVEYMLATEVEQVMGELE